MTEHDVHHASPTMTGNLAHLLVRHLDGPGRILYHQHTADGWRARDARAVAADAAGGRRRFVAKGSRPATAWRWRHATA